MLNKNKFRSQRRQAGVTIVEMMISIVLGLLLLSAATAMTVKSMVMNSDTLASAKLNQDLDSVLHVMVNDIRRAGYSGGVVPFAALEDLNIVSQSCVLYAYDADQDGILAADGSENFGFKLLNSAIQMRTICGSGSCATDCDAGTWVPLTDPNVTTITSLDFDTQFSKCLNISAAGSNGYWVTTANDVRVFPCDPLTSSSDLTSYYVDANGVYQPGTYVQPATGDRTVETRQVNIELTGHLGVGTVETDSMIKNHKVAINVRNNHVETH